MGRIILGLLTNLPVICSLPARVNALEGQFVCYTSAQSVNVYFAGQSINWPSFQA